MAPGAVRKQKSKSNLNMSQQGLMDQTTKHALTDSVIVRGIRGLLDKTNNMASDGAKSTTKSQAVATTETQHGLYKGGEHTTTNQNSKGGQRTTMNHNSKGIQGTTTNQNSKGGEHITTNETVESDNRPLNTVVPATQTPEIPPIPPIETSEIPSTESLQHPSPEAAATAAVSKKRRLGHTMCKGIMKYFVASGNKMKITVDPSIGRPINGDESGKLASQIGVVTRDVLPVPKMQKEVDERNGLEPGFDHLKIHMDINVDAPGVRQCLIDRLKISSRQKRHKLHKRFQKYATSQEAKNNKPSFCPSKEQWAELCDYFASPKFKHTSDVNKGNRKKLRCKHISGRKAFTVRSYEIELNGEPCDRIELYKHTHCLEKDCSENDGWKSIEAKENWELMIKKREQYREEGIEKSSEEIVFEVLGHGSGYIKGLGYGPKPPSRRNMSNDSISQQLQKELQERQEKLHSLTLK